LKKRIKPVLSQKRLVYTPLNSFYQVLSAESYTKHGLNVHGVVFDELHAQPNRLLYDVMTHGSGDARKQPLFFLINSYTTGLAPAVLTYMIATELKKYGGHVDSQEIGLPVSSNGLVLPCGASGRFER